MEMFGFRYFINEDYDIVVHVNVAIANINNVDNERFTLETMIFNAHIHSLRPNAKCKVKNAGLIAAFHILSSSGHEE